MTAVHLRTSGMHCPACPPRIEKELRGLPGVARVLAFRDLGIISVMFDEDLVDLTAIRSRMAGAGFETDVLVGSEHLGS